MGLIKKTKTSNSTGTNAPKKMDGYAGLGPVPPSMIGSKPGKTNKKGYTGPNVQRGNFDTNG